MKFFSKNKDDVLHYYSAVVEAIDLALFPAANSAHRAASSLSVYLLAAYSEVDRAYSMIVKIGSQDDRVLVEGLRHIVEHAMPEDVERIADGLFDERDEKRAEEVRLSKQVLNDLSHEVSELAAKTDPADYLGAVGKVVLAGVGVFGGPLAGAAVAGYGERKTVQSVWNSKAAPGQNELRKIDQCLEIMRSFEEDLVARSKRCYEIILACSAYCLRIEDILNGVGTRDRAQLINDAASGVESLIDRTVLTLIEDENLPEDTQHDVLLFGLPEQQK